MKDERKLDGKKIALQLIERETVRRKLQASHRKLLRLSHYASIWAAISRFVMQKNDRKN